MKRARGWFPIGLVAGVMVRIAALATPAAAAGAPPIEPAPPLVAHWAPVIYQDVSGTPQSGYRNDYLTRFDFDGDWRATNNKQNFDSGQYPLPGAVYYSLVETGTHYFITYAFFHPYDQAGWLEAPEAGSLCDAHENDMEGVILTIRKDGSPFGVFRVMATEAHDQVWYFKPPGSDVKIGSAYQDNDPLCFCPPADSTAFFPTPSGHTVAAFIESDGHGVGKQYRAMQLSASGPILLGSDHYKFQGSAGDGVVYFHDGGPAEVPSSAALDSVRYELRPLQELWDRRHDGDDVPYCEFEDYAGVAGRDCGLDALAVSFGGRCVIGFGGCEANPPWGWGSDHAALPRGAWFLDPAWAVAKHLALFPDTALAGYLDYASNVFLQGDTSLELALPAAGTDWYAGETVSIAWATTAGSQGPSLAPVLRVELSRNGGAWETIASAAPVTAGSTAWLVTPPAADSCRVRITAETDCFLDLSDQSEAFRILPNPTGVPSPGVLAFRLHPAQPNPLSGMTTIAYDLPVPSPVRLTIFDATGRRVRTLVDDPGRPAGPHQSVWDTRDERGRSVPAGAYFLQLAAGDFRSTGRVLLVR